MVTMAILLIYTNTLLSFKRWYDNFNCHVRCVPSTPIGRQPKQGLIVKLVFIFYSYSIALVGLFGATRNK